jgi:UDP-N-acetylmuramyl pentapeptide synthase
MQIIFDFLTLVMYRIYGRLRTLDRINQKLVFNELYNSNPSFLKEEIEFLRQFSSINTVMTYKKQIANYVKESENDKISNYL